MEIVYENTSLFAFREPGLVIYINGHCLRDELHIFIRGEIDIAVQAVFDVYINCLLSNIGPIKRLVVDLTEAHVTDLIGLKQLQKLHRAIKPKRAELHLSASPARRFILSIHDILVKKNRAALSPAALYLLI